MKGDESAERTATEIPMPTFLDLVNWTKRRHFSVKLKKFNPVARGSAPGRSEPMFDLGSHVGTRLRRNAAHFELGA